VGAVPVAAPHASCARGRGPVAAHHLQLNDPHLVELVRLCRLVEQEGELWVVALLLLYERLKLVAVLDLEHGHCRQRRERM
jgi:hypothetical protein